MKSYIYYHMKYVLYGMAIQALVTASLSFIDQIDPQPRRQALAGLIFFVLAIVIGLTKRSPDAGDGEVKAWDIVPSKGTDSQTSNSTTHPPVTQAASLPIAKEGNK